MPTIATITAKRQEAADTPFVATEGVGWRMGKARRLNAPTQLRANDSKIGGIDPLWSTHLRDRAMTVEAAEKSKIPTELQLGNAVDGWNRDAAASTMREMREDTSVHRLIPIDAQLVGGLLAASSAASQRRIAISTRRQDRSNWKYWCLALKALFVDPEPIRTDTEAITGVDAKGHRREVSLVKVIFMYWCVTLPQFKPQSMLQRLRGVSRVHKKALGIPFVSLAPVASTSTNTGLSRCSREPRELLHRFDIVLAGAKVFRRRRGRRRRRGTMGGLGNITGGVPNGRLSWNRDATRSITVLRMQAPELDGGLQGGLDASGGVV